jgi:hypothetical protein
MTLQRTLTLFSLLALPLSAPGPAARAESSAQSYLRDPPAQTDADGPRVNKIIDDAEKHFRLGEKALAAGYKKEAREEFDKAVDAVLESGMDVRSNPRLKRYYDGLVERIYRHEASSSAPGVGFKEQKLEPSADEGPAGRRVLVKNIPPNYLGNNAASVYTAVMGVKAGLSKGKFETTPEYLERLDKLLARLRVDGPKTVKDELTFVLTPSEDYDADTRVYTVKVETFYDTASELRSEQPPQAISLSDNHVRSVTLGRTSKTLGSAVGRNAFGVRKRYAIRSYSTLKLMMPAGKVAPWANGLEILNIPPARARQLMGRVRVAVRGRLAFPFASFESNHSNPTMNEPEESYLRDHCIYFEPESIFVFDGRTGEALGAADLNDQPTDRYGLHPDSTLTLERPSKAEGESPGRAEPAPPKAEQVRERKVGTRP